MLTPILDTPSISVIVTTYNWPQALEKVLNALQAQDYPNFEIIIADDGSTEETAALIRARRETSGIPLLHCWHPDEGFQAATIRNKAVAMARYDYIIFLDGDCIPRPHFVSKHAALAEKGWFVAGNRLLLSEAFSTEIFTENWTIETWSASVWLKAWCAQKCNRLAPLLMLPLGGIRKWAKQRWRGAKTCNLGMWRDDFLYVNGLDEQYVGWGYEDSDLVIRLLRAKIYRKSGQYAVGVAHLWHAAQERALTSENAKRLKQTRQAKHTKALKGIDQYLVDD